jgi:predicted DNA-binding protein
MTHDETLSVRIPKDMHAALKERERVTMVPTARLVRKLIERELANAERVKTP